MPFHICPDEIFLFLSGISFIGIFFRKLHAWYHVKVKHKEHK